MSPLLQWLIVVPLVAGAALFAAWRLITARLRLRVLSRLLQALPPTSTGVIALLARRCCAPVGSRSRQRLRCLLETLSAKEKARLSPGLFLIHYRSLNRA